MLSKPLTIMLGGWYSGKWWRMCGFTSVIFLWGFGGLGVLVQGFKL